MDHNSEWTYMLSKVFNAIGSTEQTDQAVSLTSRVSIHRSLQAEETHHKDVPSVIELVLEFF